MRLAEAERFHEKEDLAGKLTERRGEPHHVGPQTVRLRTGTEDVPEPWAQLSLRVGDVCLWQMAEHGR